MADVHDRSGLQGAPATSRSWQWVAITLIVVAAALAASRWVGRDAAPAAPAADARTPAAAIHSYWTLRDWMRRTASRGGEMPRATEVLAPVVAGGALESFDDRPGTREQLGWSLLRIEPVDADTAHAFARIRNLATDPSIRTVTPVELFDADDRTEFRYVLKRDGGAWKIVEVWRIDGSGVTARIR